MDRRSMPGKGGGGEVVATYRIGASSNSDRWGGGRSESQWEKIRSRTQLKQVGLGGTSNKVNNSNGD